MNLTNAIPSLYITLSLTFSVFRAIQEKLTEVLNSERNCIQEPRNTEVEIAVCGNGKIYYLKLRRQKGRAKGP